MIASGVRAVFDCNIFLQALAAPTGPAGRCVQLTIDGKVSLFISPVLLDELREVTMRPRVIAKMRLIEDRVSDLLATIEIAGTLLDTFPNAFSYERDPDDAHYINLALAANAKLIVSRDKDLLDLMDLAKPEAVAFQTRFPSLRILNPVEFLSQISLTI